MANEFSFMFIDIETAIDTYKMGLIGKEDFINKVQRALDEYPGETATIQFNEPGISDSMMDGVGPTPVSGDCEWVNW